jgi:hypothetical protein
MDGQILFDQVLPPIILLMLGTVNRGVEVLKLILKRQKLVTNEDTIKLLTLAGSIIIGILVMFVTADATTAFDGLFPSNPLLRIIFGGMALALGSDALRFIFALKSYLEGGGGTDIEKVLKIFSDNGDGTFTLKTQTTATKTAGEITAQSSTSATKLVKPQGGQG